MNTTASTLTPTFTPASAPTATPATLKTAVLATITAGILAGLSACNNHVSINEKDLTLGMNQYLDQRGDLCLAKNSWPIDVTQREMQSLARNAVQLPIMEKLGLVSSIITTAEKRDEDGVHSLNVRRFSLTDAGKKYYLVKEMRSMRSDGSTKIDQGDLCVARLGLDKIVKWEEIKSDDKKQRVQITYSYKILSAAPWTSDAEIRKAFPMVAQLLQGAGTMQLQETLKFSDHGWIANEL